MTKILNHWNGAVITEGDESLKDLLVKAAAAGIFLTGADLAGADLAGADLTGADLAGAVLRGAVLRGAVLRGAVLTDADLTGADLADAVLRGAVLRGAVLRGAVLTDADLAGAVLRGADIPVVEEIDKQILSLIDRGEGELKMDAWHICNTTHCRAGWAVHLAGEAGYALEKQVGSAAAGALIYAKSCPLLKIPNFYATDDEALEDMRQRAGNGC